MNTPVLVLVAIVGLIALTSIILYKMGMCTVKTQKGCIVQHRNTGRIVRVRIGPGSVWRTPILEKCVELNLEQENVQLPIANIITSDHLSIEASLLIVFTRVPSNVTKRALEKLLPNYAELGETIKVNADYIIRKLCLDGNPAKDLVSEAGRSRFESRLWNELQALERKLAYHLDAVQVLVAPNEQILNARLRAEGSRQSLDILSGYIGVNGFDLHHLLTAELLSRINQGDVDLLAAMSLYQHAQMRDSTTSMPTLLLIDAQAQT